MIRIGREIQCLSYAGFFFNLIKYKTTEPDANFSNFANFSSITLVSVKETFDSLQGQRESRRFPQSSNLPGIALLEYLHSFRQYYTWEKGCKKNLAKVKETQVWRRE